MKVAGAAQPRWLRYAQKIDDGGNNVEGAPNAEVAGHDVLSSDISETILSRVAPGSSIWRWAYSTD
jgi:hypothetical protein